MAARQRRIANVRLACMQTSHAHGSQFVSARIRWEKSEPQGSVQKKKVGGRSLARKCGRQKGPGSIRGGKVDKAQGRADRGRPKVPRRGIRRGRRRRRSGRGARRRRRFANAVRHQRALIFRLTDPSNRSRLRNRLRDPLRPNLARRCGSPRFGRVMTAAAGMLLRGWRRRTIRRHGRSRTRRRKSDKREKEKQGS